MPQRNVANLTPLSIVSGRAADYAAWPRVNVSHTLPAPLGAGSVWSIAHI